jgi:hypothetical protein
VYTEPGVTREISPPNAIYNVEYGKLINRPHYHFKVVERSHWIYQGVPYIPTDLTLVLWWRRPHRYRRHNGGIFPFNVGDQLILMTDGQKTPAFAVRVTAYDQKRGISATGHVVVEVLHRYNTTPGYTIGDLRRGIVGNTIGGGGVS